jgi:PAS domain-containing protein
MPNHAHVVQFYEDDGFLLDTLTAQMSPTLESGGAAVVVASKLHRDGLKHRLKQRGFSVNNAVHEGRYIQLDAAETLERICRNGNVDGSRFREVIGGVVKLAMRENGHTRKVVAFGEMVALLWQDGKRDAAVRLEQFWNELAAERPFTLICGYPMSCFARAEHHDGLHAVCAEHGIVLPAESYPSAGSEEERSRVVVQLQQKARALESELSLNERRIDMLQAAAGLGTWEMDLSDESVALSGNAQRMLGLGTTGRVPLSELLRVMYYSGDRDTFLAALRKARTGRKEFSAEFRVKTGTEVRILAADGKLHYNGGQPLLMGILTDVTALRQAVA